MSGMPSTVLVVAVVLIVAVLTVWCRTRTARLHRLHVRVDAARAGLATALDRRVDVALRVAGALEGDRARRLRAVATAAATSSAPAPDGRDSAGSREAREIAENALTRELAVLEAWRLERGPAAELCDAQQLVVLARRVHNDAVRDTRVLRSRRLVRWLRLHGTAPEPVYFEIADPEPGGHTAGLDVESRRHPTAI